MQTPLGDMPAIDAHAHIFPDRLFEAIWHYFDQQYWQVKYKLYSPDIAAFYREQGFAGFTTLYYAHKPNISASMNEYARNFHEQFPESIPFGTVHPGDKDLLDVAEVALTSYNLLGFKFQLLVTDFYIYDPRLFPVYDLVRREDKILVFHAGTAPGANHFVGMKRFRKFAEQYGDLRVQIAHMGGYEYADSFAILDTHPTFYLDTAMIFVDENVFPSMYDLDYQLLVDHEDQILFGSDFPNIPYDFAESWKFLFSLNLPKTFYEKIMYRNARQFYRL